MAKHGENIRRRKDGRWEGRYIKARTPDRKAVWGSVYGSSYAEVRQELIRRKAECGLYQLSGRRMRFGQLAWQWLASIGCGVKESTLAHYRYTLQRYLLPVFGEAELLSLDEQALEQGMLRVLDPADGSHRPLGSSSARECLVMLRRICKYAAHLRLIRPMEICVKLPQAQTRTAEPLSGSEQARVREFVLERPTPRRVGLLLQMELGLRIGEVCGLQWGDFDMEAGLLTVRRTVSRIYGPDGHTRLVIQTPKTRSSGREIPIPRSLPRWGSSTSTASSGGDWKGTAPSMGRWDTPDCRGRTLPSATKAHSPRAGRASRRACWSSARSATPWRTAGSQLE